MSDIDEKIRKALASEGVDEELWRERGMLAEVLAPFRGKRRWVNYVGIAYGLTANAVLLWAAYRFFTTEDASERLFWLAIGGVAMTFVVFSKVYFWMEMHTNRILREVKRVELMALQLKTDREKDVG